MGGYQKESKGVPPFVHQKFATWIRKKGVQEVMEQCHDFIIRGIGKAAVKISKFLKSNRVEKYIVGWYRRFQSANKKTRKECDEIRIPIYGIALLRFVEGKFLQVLPTGV
jgi:hypothetical protein